MQYQVSILRELIFGAVACGADFQELCRRLQVTPELLTNGEGMIPWHPDPAREFWSIAVEMTGDPLLGLHMGQRESPRDSFGMVGMLAKTCRTLGDGIRTICQYNDTLSNVFGYRHETTHDRAVVFFEPIRLWELHNEESARQAVDLSMSGFTKAFYYLTDGIVVPESIEIKYSPGPKDEYEQLLRAPVSFSANRNAIILKRTDLNVPLTSYDKSLYAVFDALLRQKQAMMNEQATLRQQIRHLLLKEFRGQIPSVEIIASRLNVTPRTLQRKLSDEHTTFREISFQLRRELAGQLLASGTARKQQVADILGYADTDTLRRALKGAAPA